MKLNEVDTVKTDRGCWLDLMGVVTMVQFGASISSMSKSAGKELVDTVVAVWRACTMEQCNELIDDIKREAEDEDLPLSILPEMCDVDDEFLKSARADVLASIARVEKAFRAGLVSSLEEEGKE